MAEGGKTRALVALGAVAAAAAVGVGLWLARGGDSAPDATEPALAGYAPSAPATGSMLRYETEYPTIPYTTGKRTDRVAVLIDKLARGQAQLQHEGERGYLESLLAALEIDPSSQTLVYSQTSLQSKLIGPKTPRAIYFNDDVYVAYVQDGPIEIASLEVDLGPVFYLLEQSAPKPNFTAELGRCMSCHDSYSLTGGGVPRFIVGSGYTGTLGNLVSHEGWILISDRTPLKNRWGGWYVTGQHGSQVHLGNMVIKTIYDFDKLEELRVGNRDTLDGLVDTKPYLTNKSDIVALLVLQHQADVQNLITRVSYDARTAADKREDPLETTVERLLDMMLFVDAVEYTDPISGDPKFAEQFASRAVRDSQGRSLRDFDLSRRLFRYPLSYLIYSPAFDALPSDVRSMFYARLNAVLTGADTSESFQHLSAADRAAILDILRDTKPEALAGVAN
ncbi:MAG TPA: hypothetical protein VNP02_15075 [Gammaproteobacteria bacterium]|jgi:hypothetical protein|nr:hypothetical protein [Gammaproteobacteria bacterium]